MIKEFIEAFILVFAAEMGDKTQILAMTFATQFTIFQVLTGIGIGVLFNHGLAILLGIYLSKKISLNYIQIGAAILFIIFGLYTLLEEDEDELEDKKTNKSPILTVALAFFIGELGDKTQLAAMSLSTEARYPLIILLGTTTAMICINSLSIFIGSKLGEKIPEKTITISSSLVFLFFGSLKLYSNLPKNYINSVSITVYLIIIIAIESYLIYRYSKKLKEKESQLKEVANTLYEQTKRLNVSLDDICLGEDKCGKCLGDECLLGFIKFILKDARENKDFYNHSKIDYESLVKKDYSKDKLLKAYDLLIEDYKKYRWDLEENFIINDIRITLEKMLFGEELKLNSINNIENYISQIENKI